jgi:hypothetical protein
MGGRLAGCGVALTLGALLLTGCATGEQRLPAGPTDAELVQLLDEQNTRWWNAAFPDEEQPIVEIVDFVDGSEQTKAVAGCLVESGYPDYVDSFGNIRFDLAIDDRDFERAYFICSVKYPLELSALGYLSEAQVAYIFDYEVEVVSPCLRLLGFDISEPPNRESYLESHRTGGGLNWSPYWDAVNLYEGDPWTPEFWDFIDFHCPPLPEPLGFSHP